ncbi:MAG: phage portal protein [Nitrosopumilus sp.]
MERTFKNLFGLIKEKAVPQIEPISERTRDGLPKAYIPKFLYKPPFGYPRFVDLPNIRRLASTPYVDMCITTIVDELSSIPWDILVKEGIEPTPVHDDQIKHVKSFYENPNTNKESFDEIRRKYTRDILEVDAGVINKIFNMKGEMVEMVARDGVTFTKNPDIFGMITDRDGIIKDSNIALTGKEDRLMEPGWINAVDVREKAAYFQYGWITGAKPVPFGKREIVWFERHPRTDSIYGRSPVEVLANTIQTLIYAVEHNLEYFNDNSIPKGVLGLEGLDAEGLKGFRDQWKEQQRKRDSAGNWKKDFHNIPIVGTLPKFERLQFTNSELELLEGQKWWAKMVWACFGVTATELGYTEDAKGLSNQIVQSNIFRKRAINPILRLEEYKHNHEILSEFDYPDLEFKFLMFDVEEETKKATLYKLQLDAGYKTINEVRRDEGMDEVEEGDEIGKKKNDFENGDPFKQEQARKEEESEEGSKKERKSKITYEEESEKIKENKKKPEAYKKHKFKPAEWTHKNGHPRCLICGDEETINGYCDSIEKKALQTEENPLIMRENEIMDEHRLKKSIVYLMKQNEGKIKELIGQEVRKDKLKEIKSIDDLAKAIKGLITFQGLKSISDAVIRHTFMKGWDSAEKQLNKNFMVNKEAISYIQDYTFTNIKGMTEELTNDLRAELERGIMQGEGVTQLTERVGKVFKKGENRAEMIARTETNRAENQGKLQAFKSSGERYDKKYTAVIDNRTSPICKRLDGQVVKMDDNFKDSKTGWGGPAPPAHVDCRSSVVFILKEEKNQEELVEAEKELKEKEEKEEKAINDKIDLKLREKEVDIKDRKDALLKRLEDDHGRNKDIYRQGKGE